jgi:hypothetical protein
MTTTRPTENADVALTRKVTAMHAAQTGTGSNMHVPLDVLLALLDPDTFVPADLITGLPDVILRARMLVAEGPEAACIGAELLYRKLDTMPEAERTALARGAVIDLGDGLTAVAW